MKGADVALVVHSRGVVYPCLRLCKAPPLAFSPTMGLLLFEFPHDAPSKCCCALEGGGIVGVEQRAVALLLGLDT